MVEHEFRKLISDIQSLDPLMGGFQLSDYVVDYNRLLERVQSLHPNNSFISRMTPIRYNYLFDDFNYVAKKITSNCRAILENLSLKTISQPQQINISIGSLQGNFSLENLISTIQNSNIGNSTEVIQYINEFKQELNKTKPDKNKLRTIIERVKNFGEGVVSALLVEVGKKFLGL